MLIEITLSSENFSVHWKFSKLSDIVSKFHFRIHHLHIFPCTMYKLISPVHFRALLFFQWSFYPRIIFHWFLYTSRTYYFPSIMFHICFANRIYGKAKDFQNFSCFIKFSFLAASMYNSDTRNFDSLKSSSCLWLLLTCNVLLTPKTSHWSSDFSCIKSNNFIHE